MDDKFAPEIPEGPAAGQVPDFLAPGSDAAAASVPDEPASASAPGSAAARPSGASAAPRPSGATAVLPVRAAAPDPAPPRPRMSLALRTAFGVVALLAVVLATFTITSLALTGRTVDEQLEQSVSEAWERSVTFVIRDPDGWGSGLSPLEAPGQPAGMLALVMTSGGVVEASRLDADGHAVLLSEHDARTLVAMTSRLQPGRPLVEKVELDAGRYLVQVNLAGPNVLAIAGLPTTPVDATKAKLAVVQVVGSLTALVLAGLLAWWWIRRSLRPLREVSRAAARVAEVPMGRGEVSLEPYRVPADLTLPGDEVGDVGHALNRLIDSVDEAFEQRNRSEQRLRAFIADASHELRTPLAAMRGYAEMIQLTEPLSESGRDSLGRVLNQSDRMRSLVEDLLLLARLDAGRDVQHENMDLGEVVVDAVMDANAAGHDHAWQVDVPDEPVMVFGDRQQLAQLVGNLLTNARVHTPAGTSVMVRLMASGGARDGRAAGPDSGGSAPGGSATGGSAPGGPATGGSASTVTLTVADNGPGIRPELLPTLFDRFVRGDEARTTSGGSTGLGLSIVRSIARAHGGDATVESAPGRTLFTVQLPGV